MQNLYRSLINKMDKITEIQWAIAFVIVSVIGLYTLHQKVSNAPVSVQKEISKMSPFF